MVLFDVKSLFTSVPLTETIDIILDRVFNRKEISTVLTKNEIKIVNIMFQKRTFHTE